MRRWALIIGITVFALLVFAVSVPIINDRAAAKTAESIRNIELPEGTEYIEIFSKAGKLVGNGNGMQYLGGILIKSDLSLEALQTYYAQYAQNEWECIVERQSDKNIRFVEHGTVSLSADIDGDNYFIVYSWGSNHFVFCEFDIRGH